MSFDTRIRSLELAIQHKAVDEASDVIVEATRFYDYIMGNSPANAMMKQRGQIADSVQSGAAAAGAAV